MRIHVILPLDYDECSVGNGGCEQKCVNQVPGYECQCDSGFSLDSDNMSCVANAECSGEGDNFVCQCLDGFREWNSSSGGGSAENLTSCLGTSHIMFMALTQYYIMCFASIPHRHR